MGREGRASGLCPPSLPSRLQKLQDAWEVRTATDSDDDGHDQRLDDDDEDALSIGGHSEDGCSSGGSEGAVGGGGRKVEGDPASSDSDGECFGYGECFSYVQSETGGTGVLSRLLRQVCRQI